MTIFTRAGFALVLLVFADDAASRADDPRPDSATPPVPLTREDVKQVLDASRQAHPRLPLPPVSEEERLRTGRPGGLGGGIVNNGRMRRYYLADYQVGDRRREPDPKMTLDYPFKTSLFWIVSRGNNCTYCLGHQESKLSAAGLSDDQIAALDGDWGRFDPSTRAAFAFTRTLSFAPHTLSDAHIDALRLHFTDDQITEMILAIAGFNATNRWTGALRIPQEEHRKYLTPTSSDFVDLVSSVAPVAPDSSKRKGLVPPMPRHRPPLETLEQVRQALDEARNRVARLPVADVETVQNLLDSPIAEDPPQWVRLLCVFPVTGQDRVVSHEAAERRGTLDRRTRAMIAYVAARHDRAWYALGHAIDRLSGLGFSDQNIAKLDDPASLGDPVDREVVSFTRTLTVNPALVSDDAVDRLREHFNDRQVAEIIYQITEAAFFNRLTEAAGLPLED